MDPVLRFHWSDFREIRKFSTFLVYITKAINCNDIKLLPAYSSLNFEKNDVFSRLLDNIFVTHSIQGKNVTITEKNRHRYLHWVMALIDARGGGGVRGPISQISSYKKFATYLVPGPRETQEKYAHSTP